MKLLLFALIGVCTLSTDVLASGYGSNQRIVVEQRVSRRERIRIRDFLPQRRERERIVIKESFVAPSYPAAVVQQFYVPQQRIEVQSYVVPQQQIVVPQVQSYVAPGCGQAAYVAPLQQQQCLGAGCF